MSIDTNSAPTTLEPNAEADRRRRRRGWIITCWLLVMMIINWAEKGVLGLAAVPIMRDLNLTPAQFGFISSSLFFLFGISQIAVGLVANRVAARWVLGALAICWALSQLPILLVAAVPALLISRIALGAAEGPATPVLVHAIYNWFPERERALPAGIAQAGASLGLVIAAPVLTLIIVRHGWWTALLLLAVASAAWAVVWLIIGKDGPYRDHAEGAAAGQASRRPAPRLPYRRIMFCRTWFGSLLSSHCGYWAFAISAAWLPAYMQKGLGYSPSQIGFLVALPPILGTAAMIGASALSGGLVRRGVNTRWSRGALQAGIVAVAGLCLIALPFASTPWLQLALIIVGFGLPPAAFPLTLLTAAEVTPLAQRAASLSFCTALLTAAGLFAPAVAGIFIGAATSPLPGFHQAFLAVGLLMVAGGFLGALLINPSRDARKLGLSDSVPSAS